MSQPPTPTSDPAVRRRDQLRAANLVAATEYATICATLRDLPISACAVVLVDLDDEVCRAWASSLGLLAEGEVSRRPGADHLSLQAFPLAVVRSVVPGAADSLAADPPPDRFYLVVAAAGAVACTIEPITLAPIPHGDA